jgi:hypothetical protein
MDSNTKTRGICVCFFEKKTNEHDMTHENRQQNFVVFVAVVDAESLETLPTTRTKWEHIRNNKKNQVSSNTNRNNNLKQPTKKKKTTTNLENKMYLGLGSVVQHKK